MLYGIALLAGVVLLACARQVYLWPCNECDVRGNLCWTGLLFMSGCALLMFALEFPPLLLLLPGAGSLFFGSVALLARAWYPVKRERVIAGV